MVSMCRVLRVHRSGYYSWIKKPLSNRAVEDQHLLTKIRESYLASGGIYGSPRIHSDLKEIGENCGENRVARLMRQHGLRAIRGYKKPRYKSARPATVAPNRLNQCFDVTAQDLAWATDITYIRTHEGWLYLAVVVDLYSRMVVGWSMQPTLERNLVLNAVLMAVWKRRPKKEVIVHSDQGSQYGSDDWIRFSRDHNLKPSMSRRGNCYDNAVAESFFSSLKKERVRRKIYKTRREARTDLFDYKEVQIEAENGQKALEVLAGQYIDLILMDVQMPIMDGLTASTIIRASETGCDLSQFDLPPSLLEKLVQQRKERHIPIVAMTANAMVGDKEKCLAAGMDGYLTKPFQPQQVKEIIANIVA